MPDESVIVVVDDNLSELVRLVDLIKEVFPSAVVLPKLEEPKTFSRWDEVLPYVRSAPEGVPTILCLDLSLGEQDYSDAMRGLREAVSIRAMRHNWILIAYTRFGTRISSEPLYIEHFDGLIEKANIDSKNRKQRLDYVRKSVEAAIRKKTNTEDVLPPGMAVVDSMGMRVFRAAFGDSAIAEIARNEASQWEDVRLEALTSGHSGAFMLSISGSNNGGGHSLVLKVARDEKTIEQEIRAQQRFLGQLGPLAGHLAVLDSESIRLGADAGVYYRQARIDGVALLDILKDEDKRFDREFAMRRIVDLCLNVCAEINRGKILHAAGEFFKLTSIDVGRIEASVTFLSGLGAAIVRHGLWDFEGFEVDMIGGDIISLARAWARWSVLGVSLWGVIQHGDLNPGNVIVAKDGSPILIDLARLGIWPVGYDLSRLSLMLRLRLVDWKGSDDWFHFGLPKWIAEPTGLFEPVSSDAICMASVYCDQRFGEFTSGLDESLRLVVEYGYRLGTLWDLLKVISYQDASPYKRMWAMIEAWRLKIRLEEDLELIQAPVER